MMVQICLHVTLEQAKILQNVDNKSETIRKALDEYFEKYDIKEME